LVEAGIEQQACLGLYRFHEAATYTLYLNTNIQGKLQSLVKED